jgi:outer membrane lipoprotein-sorting protein
MKMSRQIAFVGLPILICMGVCQPAGAQASSPAIPGSRADLGTAEVVNNLVRKNLERSRALGAYRGTRTYRLEYRGFPGSRTAEMVVEVSYKSPGTKQFTVRSETGSKLLIDRVFKKMLQSEKEALSEENQSRVALNQDNYSFTLLGHEETPLTSLYILAVEPRTQNKLLYRGRIWVDAEDFAVVRIEGEPAKNPSFWTKDTKIEQVYTKVGNFWLPRSNRSTSSIRLGGHAVFAIDYADYQITASTPLSQPDNKVAGYR